VVPPEENRNSAHTRALPPLCLLPPRSASTSSADARPIDRDPVDSERLPARGMDDASPEATDCQAFRVAVTPVHG
jgi:hypothetical protein